MGSVILFEPKAGNTRTMAYTNLHDLRRHARLRLLGGLVVGGLMFAGGIGVVELLRLPEAPADAAEAPSAPDPAPDARAVAAAPTPAPSAPKTASPAPPSPALALGDPTAPDDTPPEDDPPPGLPAELAPDPGRAPSDGRPRLGSNGELTPAALAANGRPDDEAPGGEVGGGGDDSGGAADPDAPWWEQCRGRPCKLDFGTHRRILVREGTLRRDGQYGYKMFKDNPVTVRAQRDKSPRIVAHHFGFHSVTRKPAMAYVTLRQDGREYQGVLPLRLGSTHLELIPSSR